MDTALFYSADARQNTTVLQSINFQEKSREIWETLSKIDVTPYVEKKVGLTYLPWAWAWAKLMDNYPDSDFYFERNSTGSEVWHFPDGSCEVRCVLTVSGITRRCWLPVMDNRNNAVKEADARDINDTKMRCLVKNIALFGLGHYIFTGETAPVQTPSAQEEKKDTQDSSTSFTLDSSLAYLSEAADKDDLRKRTQNVLKAAANRGLDGNWKEQVIAHATAVSEKFNGK